MYRSLGAIIAEDGGGTIAVVAEPAEPTGTGPKSFPVATSGGDTITAPAPLIHPVLPGDVEAAAELAPGVAWFELELEPIESRGGAPPALTHPVLKPADVARAGPSPGALGVLLLLGLGGALLFGGGRV